MSIVKEYKRQRAWRDWPTILDSLPPLQGQTVLDLGCGVGDVAADLAARGARVIGIDMNEELLAAARSRGIANAEFRLGDLRPPASLVEDGTTVDGIWASFVAAYFVDLTAALASWTRHLRRGGWVALTEINGLFEHEPLELQTVELLKAYSDEALAAGRYDFRMGAKLTVHLERAGLDLTESFPVSDKEFSFDGPAKPAILEAWTTRLDRMKLLRDFCGPNFDHLRDDFLGCLARSDHRSLSKVRCCVAWK